MPPDPPRVPMYTEHVMPPILISQQTLVLYNLIFIYQVEWMLTQKRMVCHYPDQHQVQALLVPDAKHWKSESHSKL